MKYLSIFIFLVVNALTLKAQDPNLANQYLQDGEYEKAAVLFEKLYQVQEVNDYYFEKYVECLSNLNQFEKSETVIQKRLKKNPKEVNLYVSLGELYEKQNKEAEAKALYQKAIDKMTDDRYFITKLANAFTNLSKFDYAIATYEKGGALTKDKTAFAYNVADLYRNKGDNAPKMIENYLNALQANPSYINNLKMIFQRYLGESDYLELQTQLYTRVQEKPDATDYIDLLSWVFLQRKDYKNAFRQAKALDKQLDENGGRVFQIAETANADKDFEAAIIGYEYIVVDKGSTSTYFFDSKRKLLDCRRKKIVEKQDYTQEDLRTLEREYEAFITEQGRSRMTANIMMNLADLEAFYLKDQQKAIELLKEVIAFPGIDRTIQAQAKLSLGDFYLIGGEIWESTLLYSQVDKDFKDDILGHEARFRNAKLSYYNGDFEWAQSQFTVLKSSTSKLISNDAIDLSVFLMDNTGLDTITKPMELYTQAELLIYQNKYEEAFMKFDSIKTQFPNHSLEDDLYWLEGNVYRKKQEFAKAIDMYQKILDTYKDGIRADNALYAMAQTYDGPLHDPKKAQTLYERLFMEFSGSVFAVDARKEFRRLRGDKLE
jgi:tetratricopeptide (TPR) repeat protein